MRGLAWITSVLLMAACSDDSSSGDGETSDGTTSPTGDETTNPSTGPTNGTTSVGTESTGPTTTMTTTGPTSTTDTGADCDRPGELVFEVEILEASQAPWGKDLADIDGDGLMDAVEGGGGLGSDVFWYRAPMWEKFQIGGQAGGDWLETADIDSDGAVDVVVNGGSVVWYRNPAGGGGDPTEAWTASTISGSGAHDLAVRDLDGDSRPDVVVRQPFGSTTLCLQTAADSWSCRLLPQAPDGEGTALADVDGDGAIDVVGNGYWLEQPDDPENGMWTRHDFGTWPQGSSVGVADINNDGREDVVLAASEVGPGEIAWFEKPADPIGDPWTRHDIDSVEDVHRLHVIDVDGDDQRDIVFAEMHQSPTDRVGIFLNLGMGASWDLLVIDTQGSHNIDVADVEGDGDIDILGANHNTNAPDEGALKLWRSQWCMGG